MVSKRTLVKGALAVAIAAVSVSAFATHSWNNYHWARTTSSFNLGVIDSTTPSWDSQTNAAVSQWSASSKMNLSVTSSDDTSTTRRNCSAVLRKVRVCNYAYGNNGWLGLASINLDSKGHISQGTAKMNDSYASSFADVNEKYHVMCQEVGHTLGLGHTSENGSTQNTCMDYSTSPTSTRPNQHDYDMLASIYAHTDSYSSYSLAAAASTASQLTASQKVMAGDTPVGVRVHKGRFEETWAAPDGRGGLWIHHLTLAPGFEHLDVN